jgi:hypothetical protein
MLHIDNTIKLGNPSDINLAAAAERLLKPALFFLLTNVKFLEIEAILDDN